MRNFFTLLLVLAGFNLAAQTYNNEWIDYNKTYQKFMIGRTAMYRIPQSALAAAGLDNTPVENLQLWREGVQVHYFASVNAGILPANGYIEFYGEKLDGKADKQLYLDPNSQLTDKASLMGDSVAYYLTSGNTANPFQTQPAVNNAASSSLTLEPFLMYTFRQYFTNKFNPGKANVLPEYVYLSSYDEGEFRSSLDITPTVPRGTTIPNMFPAVNSGPASSSITFSAAGNAPNERTIKTFVNNQLVTEQVMNYFKAQKFTVSFPTSYLNATSVPVRWENGSAISTDRYVAGFVEINYPREFNFANQTNFEFVWPAKGSPSLIEVTGFNNGGVTPVLIDLDRGLRYTAHVVAGKFRFELPASGTDTRYVMASTAAASFVQVNTLLRRNFINYVSGNPNANYIIISNAYLYGGTNGNNPIEDYKAYRETSAGGGFKVLNAEIEQLVDQFAYGIKKNPLSIRNFLEYARTHLSAPPKYAFLIGKGVVYNEYVLMGANANPERLNLIPTWGHPGSDNLLAVGFTGKPIAQMPIGRLSAIYPKEVEDYLEKIKDYDATQRNSPNTLAGREWMKNVVHVTGSSEPHLGSVLCNYMGTYRDIIKDTLFGGKVTTFCKVSTNSVEQLTSDKLVDLFNEGISLLTYFGHSSSSTLEFNIDDPYSYSNQGKYPVFCVNGCNAGNFFSSSSGRFTTNETITEKFLLAKNRGAIGFIASTHLGIVSYLNLFLDHFYSEIAKKDYGKSLGQILSDGLGDLVTASGPDDFYARMHAEQITLHGDPAVFLNGAAKPDYVMEESGIKINPAFISVAESSFKLKVRMVNIGRATADSITVEIKRQFPDNSFGIIYKKKIRGIMWSDSLSFDIPIVSTRDKGRNRIYVTLDSENAIDEEAESNNTAFREFVIFDEEARPTSPYNLSIINEPVTKFYASTANPFSNMRDYVMELDTTLQFNSSLKVTASTSSKGGILEFSPSVVYKDSAVYYWRVATVPPPGETHYQWNTASFTYMAGSNIGSGQDHFFQHQATEGVKITLDSDRKWRLTHTDHLIEINTGVFPWAGNTANNYSVSIDGVERMNTGCIGKSIVFQIIDPKTFQPWLNVGPGNTNLNIGGSADANCEGKHQYNIEFSYESAATRKKAMDFIDAIPDGYWVIARSLDTVPIKSLPATWRADTALYGSGKSLYHKLLQHGFWQIDTIKNYVSWTGIFKKNDPAFTPLWKVSISTKGQLKLNTKLPSPDSVGIMSSPLFGPAQQWSKVMWRGAPDINPSHAKVGVQVVGVNLSGTETTLFDLNESEQDFDISSVDPKLYPFIRLRMRNADSVDFKPYQLRYWNVFYSPVPEGMLAPNLAFNGPKDTLEIGDIYQFAIPFKNISKTKFADSIAVKLNVTNRNNVTKTIFVPKQKDLQPNDTAMVRVAIDTKDFPGENTVYLDMNPDNAQPEQYHFNNFLFRDMFVKPDYVNPLLDVTFDGVRIINRDIVSAKPHIQIKLKDDAKFMLLNDTSIGSVTVRYPDNSIREYHFDNDTLRFTPATSGANNTATIDFTPAFTSTNNSEGDEYELAIKAKDKSGNRAGTLEYRIAFRVITKSMISNLLNYPNPFSTSTAFVFTLTGSEIPTNIKIQILTITGKIVREITKDELGPIHIGRNITEFKWNGTDQYGQKLGNGVYLYRVVTTMNGKAMEKYRSEGDNTDRYFTNGYGKMYLMR
ncbi:hypothetical protein HHL16_18375 [Pseudoflavitalea sp. G-6-1-2]|uniref:putative type IX secretion system sortase PorU2 n=1 Tax=Pseudoflavitalea sp. G-6-1-2 TaxID=2728841 RepID=UPI00146E175E|nr:C25 family cysteine peptidase [Pseudoflavitalea sp. G-6-1-2]NML22857.1 hypothetical protein [Pseudoflavitalea sp. G-6-1-2]